jgi:putative nucleotidyltransferase with HDIG domain
MSLPDEKLIEMSRTMDEFEGYPAGHAEYMAAIAERLAAAFNMASRDRNFLRQAALLHDIGELPMKRSYISSAAGLTDDERYDLQRHPVIGEQEASKLGLPRGVQLIIRWHHEWWNGAGYPDAIAGGNIPLAARILRVVDCYASMTASRPFRNAVADEDARRYMTEWAGIEFDPAIVLAFRVTTLPERGGTAARSQDVSPGEFSIFS